MSEKEEAPSGTRIIVLAAIRVSRAIEIARRYLLENPPPPKKEEPDDPP